MSGNAFSFASPTVLRNRDGSVASTALDMLQALRSREQSVAPQSGPAAAGALGTPPAGLASALPASGAAPPGRSQSRIAQCLPSGGEALSWAGFRRPPLAGAAQPLGSPAQLGQPASGA